MKTAPGDIVIVGRLRRGQLILTQVRAVAMLLAGGDRYGAEITIGNTALRDKLLRKHRAKV